MYKKRSRRLIAAVLITGSLTFVPEIYNLPLTSVAYAEIEKYTGTFDYPMQEKGNLEDAREAAKNEAIRIN